MTDLILTVADVYFPSSDQNGFCFDHINLLRLIGGKAQYVLNDVNGTDRAGLGMAQGRGHLFISGIQCYCLDKGADVAGDGFPLGLSGNRERR